MSEAGEEQVFLLSKEGTEEIPNMTSPRTKTRPAAQIARCGPVFFDKNAARERPPDGGFGWIGDQ